MSSWGVFHDDEDCRWHVAPCDDAGKLLPPHETNALCPCQPKPDGEGGYVHNDRERGGANA